MKNNLHTTNNNYVNYVNPLKISSLQHVLGIQSAQAVTN